MSLRLKVEGEIIEVNPKFTEVSTLLQDLVSQSSLEEVFELNSTFVSRKAFDIITKYYEFNQFAPTIITQSSEDPDVLFLNAHDKELMMPINPFQGDFLKELLKTAVYLNVIAFKKLCLARILVEFYFDKNDSHESLNKLQKKYENVPPLTLSDVEKYKKLYPQLVSEFK